MSLFFCLQEGRIKGNGGQCESVRGRGPIVIMFVMYVKQGEEEGVG